MRFTIRDLLWLTLLAAVAVAWWVDRERLVDEIADLSEVDSVFFRSILIPPNDSARVP